MTADEALRSGISALRNAGISNPAQDARILLAHVWGVPAERLILHMTNDISDEVALLFSAAVSARGMRQPVSQIIGSRLFWGRFFRVTRDVLDPRPETEILVSAALERPFDRVLDLGTGSGCILLSCLADRVEATGIGTDISEPALAVAKENALMLGIADRASFQQSDWCRKVEGRFDLIISNPPYIAKIEMNSLEPEVRDWEPHIALTPGGDGLDAYRQISQQAPARLMAGGRLMVEIGPSQASDVAAMFSAQGLRRIEVRQDFDGRDRLVIAVKAG